MQWAWKSVTADGKAPEAWWTKAVGYGWAATSFWVSLPMAGDVMLKMRMGQDTPLPFTLFGWLSKHINVPTT